MDAVAAPSAPPLWAPALQAAVLFGGVVVLYPVMAWLDRWAEHRRMPLREAVMPSAGGKRQRLLSPWLPLVFALKALAQRDALPIAADRRLHALAPFLGFLPPLGVLACLPWVPGAGPSLSGPATPGDASVAVVLALLLLASASPLVAAFASANHLALLSALRLAQVRICALGVLALGLTGVALRAQSHALTELVRSQGAVLFGALPALGAFVHPVGGVTSLLALALWGQQSGKSLPGARPELIPGHAEESGGPTLLFHRFAEVMDFTALSACIATAFGGGFWAVFPEGSVGGVAVGGLVPFVGKSLLCGLLLAWLRRILPRLRHDQALRLLWLLLPLSLGGLGVPLAFSLLG